MSHLIALPSAARGPAWPAAVLVALLVIIGQASWQLARLPVAPAALDGGLPLSFAPNRGQARPEAQMEARGLGGTLSFLPGAVILDLPAAEGASPAALRLELVGARPDSAIVGADPRPGLLNIVRGADPAGWQLGLPTYGALTYRGLYPGVDLRYDGRQGTLKGTYLVAAGADPAPIAWRYPGAALRLDPASGDLLVALADGRELVERAPIAWQEPGGARRPVEVRYALQGDTVRFALGAYDPALPLVIDPELVYGSFMGGSSSEVGYSVAVGASGDIYLAGRTYSADFPASGEARGADADLFVARFDPTGRQLRYSTVIGGSELDEAEAVAVSAAGEAAVTITTFSANFPLLRPLSRDLSQNGALLKLNGAGQPVFSTFIGLKLFEAERNVAFGGDGSVYVAGDIDGDIGLLRVSADGARLLAEQSLGGERRDHGVALAVGPGGAVYVTGGTASSPADGFPVSAGALQPVCATLPGDESGWCEPDAFVLVLDAGLQLTYATYLGGSAPEEPMGIAVDGQGYIVVAGTTHSADFPTAAAFQRECPDGADEDLEGWCASRQSFVTRLSPDGKRIVFSTYFSSTDWSFDMVGGVAVDGSGAVYLAGTTNGLELPVKDAPQPSLARGGVCGGAGSERFCYDAFLAAFTPAGALRYSTYLGGSGDDEAWSVAVTAGGETWLTGGTQSANFPVTAGAYQPTKSLNKDLYLARVGAGASQPPTPEPPLNQRLYLPLLSR